MDNILIYNTSFFDISQTFIYHQAESLAGSYEVHLIASKFLNPHDFPIDHYKQFEIHRANGLINRVAGKVFNKQLFKFDSHKKLNQLFKDQNYKVVHAHFGTKGLEILPYAKKHNVPLVVSFHGADASRMLKQKSYVEKLPELFDYSSAIIISSRHMADNLGLDNWESKVRLIPYGINPEEFSGIAGGNTNGKITLLHSGRIVGKKGVPDLIKVFNNLTTSYSNLELNLIGDGEEMEKSRKLVGEFGLEDQVHFYGAVSHDEVKRQMEKADIFVLNSRVAEDGDMEGTPVTMLEAMCMGRAVVSTRHAGIPYVIEHGKNGLLADEKSNEQLQKNIEVLINNPQLRSELGKQARNTIQASYSIKIMKEKIRTVFKEL